MRPRRIAIVAFSAPPHSSGGVSSAHFNLFRALQRAGRQARLFTFGDHGRKDEPDITRRGTPSWLVRLLLKVNGLMFGLLQPDKRAYQTVDIVTSLIGAWRMSRSIAIYQPDVIILSDHGAPGLMLKKPRGAKIVLISHHNPARFIFNPKLADFSDLDARWALRLEQHVLKNVNAVVCPSSYMQDWFRRSYRFPGLVQVIPNLVDGEMLDSITAFDLRPQLGLKPKELLVYIPSGGSRLKGSQYIPQIIKILCGQSETPIGFYIPGGVSPDFLNQVSEMPAQARFCIAGQIPYEEHIANMKSCSFGISPSIIENYSMALLEAVYCGVPMLAFDTGGNADIIRSGENGYLVSEGDVNALGNRAIHLLNAKKLETLQTKTSPFSRKELSSTKALNAYLELIASL